jgi:hypothetical protein
MKGRTGSPQNSLIAGLVMLGLVVGLQSAVADETLPCPAGGQKFDQSGTVDGVSFQASGNSLTMTNTTTSEMATVSWCAEGTGNPSNGGSFSDVMSTSIPGGESRSSSVDQEIGHFVVYSVVHQDSGGPGPPPGNGGGGDGNGGSSDGGGGDDRGTRSKSGRSGGSRALAPPPPGIVSQPSVTG